jgi:hypothetical protein
MQTPSATLDRLAIGALVIGERVVHLSAFEMRVEEDRGRRRCTAGTYRV